MAMGTVRRLGYTPDHRYKYRNSRDRARRVEGTRPIPRV